MADKLLFPFISLTIQIVFYAFLDVFGDSVPRKELRSSYQPQCFRLHPDRLSVSIQNGIDSRIVQRRYRFIQRKTVFTCQRLDNRKRIIIFVFSQWLNSPFPNAFFLIGNNFIYIVHDFFSQPVATGARSVRRIERERMGSRFIIGNTGSRTHQVSAVITGFAAIVISNHNSTFSLAHRLVEAFCQTFADSLFYNQTVHHQLYIMYLVTV